MLDPGSERTPANYVLVSRSEDPRSRRMAEVGFDEKDTHYEVESVGPQGRRRVESVVLVVPEPHLGDPCWAAATGLLVAPSSLTHGHRKTRT